MKRRNVKSFLAMLLCIVLTATMLCGCGEEKSDSGKITIVTWDKPSNDADQSVKDLYEARMARVRAKFPNIEIIDKSVNFAGDYRQEYDKALMSGTAPTYFTMFSYTDIPGRIQNGTVRDMSKYIADWSLRKEGKVLSTFDEAISKDGKWYAVPRDGYLRGTMYNKTLLKEFGADVENLPDTWAEFTKLGAEITDFSIPRIGYELIGMDWCAWPFTTWVWSAGGEMVRSNGDGTYKLAFNEEAGVDAAVLMNEMIWKHRMTQKDVLQDMGAIGNDVVTKKAVFAFDTIENYSVDVLKEYGLSYDDFGVMPIPAKSETEGKPAVLAGGEVITFNPKASEEEIEAAWKVIEFMYYDTDECLTYAKESVKSGKPTLKIPARIDLYDEILAMNDFVPAKTIEELEKMAEIARPEPYCGEWAALKSELAIPLQKIYLKNGISRSEVKALLDDCAKTLYKKYPNSFKK